jgi:hypothetical protein
VNWSDLEPDVAFVDCLDYADRGGTRTTALGGTSAAPKNQWSNRLADACARMVADEMRRERSFKALTVLPDPQGANEPPTFVAGGKRKKVDVVAASLVSELQVGVSLKGMNFRDRKNLNFDKNLTGRTYELQDEVRVVHGYQPAAFFVAMYFMPLASTADKRTTRSVSSFARVVEHLRARTGRIDPTLPSHLDRADMAVVALYVAGDSEQIGNWSYEDALPRGVIRYFDVSTDPPRRGRPKIDSTSNLKQIVALICARYTGEGDSGRIQWADPETDAPV